MSSICYGGYVQMNPDKVLEEYDPYSSEGYPFGLPKVYLDGTTEQYFPQTVFSWSDDSVVLVRDKRVIVYTQSSFAELLAKDEEGNIVWMDGRTAPFENCWKGEYLDEVRGATEYTVVEYDLETFKKKKYTVTLNEETSCDFWDVKKLLDFVDADVLKDKFVIEDGMLTLYFGTDTDLVIPESVTAIGYHAFSQPYLFERIIIPKSVVDIPPSMFEMCKAKSVEVAKDNPKYRVQNGCLIDNETSTLVWCYDGNSIPSDGTVVTIGPYAFFQRDDLESIVIPNTITEIKPHAFHKCKNLKIVTVPDSIEIIGCNAFAYCTSLKEVSIPERLGKMDDFILQEAEDDVLIKLLTKAKETQNQPLFQGFDF